MATDNHMSVEEIQSALVEREAAYVQAKFDHAVSPMQDPSVLGKMRKEIARLKTSLRNHELAAFTPEQLALRSRIRFRRAKKH